MNAETARLYLIDYCHPTRRGNELAAETLAEFLEECGTVECITTALKGRQYKAQGKAKRRPGFRSSSKIKP